jgi:hypothetical protein
VPNGMMPPGMMRGVPNGMMPPGMNFGPGGAPFGRPPTGFMGAPGFNGPPTANVNQTQPKAPQKLELTDTTSLIGVH